MSEQSALLNGERVTIVAYAEGPEFCGAPFDKGRSVHPVMGDPKPGTPMVLVRFPDERREWHASRKVTTEHAERVQSATEDFLSRKQEPRKWGRR